MDMLNLAPLARWAYRSLRATPLVSLLAILSLGLGIGANTALFSILNGLLLRPLPVQDPESLVVLDDGSWTYPIWQEIQRRERDLSAGAFAWGAERFDLALGGETNFVDGAYVSGRMFDLLGVPAFRGRLFAAADDEPGPDRAVVVISHRFWQRHFSSDESVLGRQLTLNRVSFVVAGVLPPGFSGLDVGDVSDVFIPFGAEPLLRGTESFLNARSTWWLHIGARLKPGQTADQASAALRAVQPQIRAATMPEDYPAAFREGYLREGLTFVPAAGGRLPGDRGGFRTPLFAMMAVVALVLLIACANIANLLMARTVARRQELSVRMALGASRWQLASLLAAESVLLAVTGAALGFFFAEWTGPLIIRQLGTWRESITLDLTPDWRVLSFTSGVTMATAFAAGLAPAWRAARAQPGDVLKAAGRGVVGDRRFSVGGALVVGQIALSLVLVVAAGLFLRTLASLASAPLGFAPERLIVVDVDVQRSEPDPTLRPALLERLREAAAGAAGVDRAAVSMITPTSGRGWNNGVGENALGDRSRMTWMNAVSPGWFATYGMHLVAGRDFERADRRGTEPVTVVNAAFARRFIQGSPVGQTVQVGEDVFRVVGVVSDAVYRSPREGMMPTMFVPLAQREQMFPEASIVVAAAPSQRAAVQRSVAAALGRANPDVSFTFRTFDQLIGATVAQNRLVALLSGFFGVLALLLAGIGLYGVMSHTVSRRRGEIGIRMALGAEPRAILRLVLGRVGVLVGLGITLGLALSLWAAPLVEAMLFQLDARDPVTFTSAAAVLLVVGGLAAWLPARRAARVDPAGVLRDA
jgi:predicted permease